MSDKDKTRPRGRPKASGIRKLSKSVTVKFSRIDYERLLHRSRQANRTLAEFIREAAFEARIVPGIRRRKQPSYAILWEWRTT